jgi:P4 family phage/plasmid primase-like protien
MVKNIKDSKYFDSIKAKFNLILNVGNKKDKFSGFFKNWQNNNQDLTSSDSQNIAINTGKNNGITVIDLDAVKEYLNEKCGIELFETYVCPINQLTTLTTKSTNGGYHIYYKYTSKLKTGAKLNIGDFVYSIDVRNDKACATEGENYPLFIDANELEEVPDSLIELFTRNDKIVKYEEKHKNEVVNKNGIKLILDNLKPMYYDTFVNWFNVICVLKNLNVSLETVIEFSSKSSHFIEGKEGRDYVAKHYNNLEKREIPGIGTLYFYLKDSVSEHKYKKLIKDIANLESTSDDDGLLKINDFQVYDLFEERYKDKVFTLEDNSLYICNESGIFRNIETSNKVFCKVLREFNDYLKENEYNYSLENRANRALFNREVLSYIQVDFELNNNPNLFAFNNGVFDFTNMSFRKAYTEEYITNTCGYDYKYADSKIAYEFMSDLFPDKSVLNFMLPIYATYLTGLHPREEFIVLYNKVGSNGKTMLITIFGKMFGDFFYACSSDYLISGNNQNPEGASPILCGMKDKKFISYSEIPKKSKLNSSRIKSLTGGDTIRARSLHKESISFKITAGHQLVGNNIPFFSELDGGVLRRVHMVPMETQFVDVITKPYHKLRKYLSNQDLEELKHSMFQLLVENYKPIPPTPEKILRKTQEYFEKQDMIRKFINEHIVKDEDSFITKKELKEYTDRQEIKEEYEMGKQKDYIEDFESIIESDFTGRVQVNYKDIKNVLKGYKLKEPGYEEDDLVQM